MTIVPEKYIRKPLYVDAVRVSAANFDEIAAWCQGEVLQDEVPGTGTTKKYIKVRVHNPKNPRQTKAFVGDWLLYTERGYKVYTNKAFHASFDLVQEVVTEAVQQIRAEEGHPPVKGVHLVENEAIQSVSPPGSSVSAAGPVDVETEQKRATLVTVPPGVLEDDTPIAPPPTPKIVPPPSTVPPVKEPERTVEDVPDQEPIVPAAAEGKRVLSIAEQGELTGNEVRELLQSGEAVLAQDLAQP